MSFISFEDYLKEAGNEESLIYKINLLQTKKDQAKEKLDKLKLKIKSLEGDERQVVEFELDLTKRKIEDIDLMIKIERLKDRIKKDKERESRNLDN